MLKGEKPHLERVGPLSYEERRIKHSFTWDYNRSHVNYKYNRTFHLIERKCGANSTFAEMCSIDPGTFVTTLNIPLTGVLVTLASLHQEALAQGLIKVFNEVVDEAKKEDLFVEKSMENVIFGYDDPLLGLINSVIGLADILGVKLDLVIPPTYQLQINNSVDAYTKWSSCNTGLYDKKLLGQYTQQQGSTNTRRIWIGCDDGSKQASIYNAQANMINGTEGIQFSPGLNKSSRPYTYTEDLQLSARMM